MSLSKSLTSAVAALTVAGAVGLAYAQSTPDTTRSAPTSANSSQPVDNTVPSTSQNSAPSSSNMPSSSSSTTTTDTTTSSGMQTDLEPKADRN